LDQLFSTPHQTVRCYHDASRREAKKAAEKCGLIQRKRIVRVEAFQKKENQYRLDTFVYTLEAVSLF